MPSLHRTLQAVRDSGRTPLVLSSKELTPTINDIAHCQQNVQTANFVFLRKLGLAFENNDFAGVEAHRTQLREQYEHSLVTLTPWNLQVLLDVDSDDGEVWDKNYYPDLNMLFGKYGLPQAVWHGKDIFKSAQTCPDAIKQHLEEHF